MVDKKVKDTKLLKKAEEIIKRESDSSNGYDEVNHNLRVHQIELEIQNEELKEAQIKLINSQRKYFDL